METLLLYLTVLPGAHVPSFFFSEKCDGCTIKSRIMQPSHYLVAPYWALRCCKAVQNRL